MRNRTLMQITSIREEDNMKTMKKAISVLLLVCMVSALCSAGAYADEKQMNFDNAPTSMNVGDTSQRITVSGYNNDDPTKVKWANLESSDTSIISVDTYANTLTAVKAGEATITSKCWISDDPNSTYNSANEKYIATKKITVVGTAAELTAEITPSSNTLTVAASKGGTSATITNVVWESNNTNITVTGNGGNNAMATIASNTPDADQTATITATVTVEGGGTAIATKNVTIPKANIPVTSVTVTPATATLVKGNNVALTATVNPDNATDKNVTWSANPDVLSWTAAGVFTVKDGATVTDNMTVSVTATAGGVDSAPATIRISVPAKPVPATNLVITADNGKTTIEAYSSVQLKYSVEPTGAGIDPKTLRWESADTGIATVDNNGLVSGVKSGTVKITATAADISNPENIVSGDITITVIPVKVNKIELVSAVSIEVGNTKTITATALPANAENRKLTWGSNSPEVASVTPDSNDSSTVIITANKVGTAVITAIAADGSGTSAKCTVTVTEPAAYRVVITPNSMTLGHRDVGYFTAKIYQRDNNGNYSKDVSGIVNSLNWSFTGDVSNGIGITGNAYDAKNNYYTATVLGRFNRNYTVYAECKIGTVTYNDTASVTVSYAPAIVSGQNAVYNGRDAMSFLVNDSFDNFTRPLYVDGRAVNENFYSISRYGDEGYLVVTLNQSFLNFLCQYYNNNGYHTISIGTKYGAAASYFRTWGTASSFYGVKTGDDANLGLWAALLAVSAAGAGAAVVIYKRRKKNNG